MNDTSTNGTVVSFDGNFLYYTNASKVADVLFYIVFRMCFSTRLRFIATATLNARQLERVFLSRRRSLEIIHQWKQFNLQWVGRKSWWHMLFINVNKCGDSYQPMAAGSYQFLQGQRQLDPHKRI